MAKCINLCYRKLTGYLCAFLGFLLAVRILIPVLALFAVNVGGPILLGTGIKLEDFDLKLLFGLVAVDGLRIEQPELLEEDVFLEVERLSIRVKPLSLISGRPVIDKLLVKNVEIKLVKNPEGLLTTDILAGKASAGSVDEDASGVSSNSIQGADSDGAVIEPVAAPSTTTPLVVNRLRVKNLSFAYHDLSVGDVPILIELEDVNLYVSNLVVQSEIPAAPGPPCEALLSGILKQGDAPDGYFGAKVLMNEVVPPRPPSMRAAIRVVGFELDTLGSALPPGIAQTLGGGNLDVSVNATVLTNALDVSISVATVADEFSISVGGTPDSPKIDGSEILLNVVGKLGGGAFKVAGMLGEAGVETAKAAAGSAVEVGKGAVGVVGKAGGGLFKGLKGLAKGDLKEAGAGLKDATVGSVQEVAETASTASSKLGEGVKGAAASATGVTAAEAWRANVSHRWSRAWRDALQSVSASPISDRN